jgi:hypothetical protein
VRDPAAPEYWKSNLRIATNLNGPAVGLSNLSPPLTPTGSGSWMPNSAGIKLGVNCPFDQGPNPEKYAIWLVWSGMNWRSAEEDALAEIDLCTLRPIPTISPGCLPVPGADLLLVAAACDGGEAFDHHYGDNKGKEIGGQPWDTAQAKNSRLGCTTHHAHNYTRTVLDFSANHAAQTLYPIKNEAVVHNGSGTTYMAVCWTISYWDFLMPLAPVYRVAHAHDWLLVLDLGGQPKEWTGAVARHLGGQEPQDKGVGTTAALRGIYDESPTNAGENGFGPCPTSAPLPEGKKPAPII